VNPASPLRLICPVLVGRDAELASLEAILAEVVTGSGRVALVGGDAGIGKSRLLDAFLARARASGARTVVGYCAEAEARRPFGPFIDLLRGVRELPRPMQTESDLALADPNVRYRALRSFASAVEDVASDEPLVVAVDDLQWADEATLELFAYLARSLRGRQVLLVGFYRTDELHRLHPLRDVLATLVRARLADSLILRPLTLAGTHEMVGATLGSSTSVPRELSTALQERCEGNPFFVEEVLKALAQAGDLVWRDGSWLYVGGVADMVIPASLRDIVQGRLDVLPNEARAALRVAAVIGISFDLALLQELTGMTDQDLNDVLRAAVAAQLVDEVSRPGIDRFRFRHALTRESVLADLLGRERRELHRQVAASLEAQPGPQVEPEELAYHFDEAGEREPAFRYHVRASAHAETLFAFGNARKHLGRALELADANVDLAELQLRFSRAALLAGDGRAALNAAKEARGTYEKREDVRGTALALCAVSDADWYLGHADEARRVLEESVRVLESLGDPCELGDAYRRMAVLALFNDDPRTDWAERTIEVGRRCGQRVTEVIGLISLAGALSQQGRAEALENAEQAVRLALEIDAPDLVFRARVFLIDIKAKRGASPIERRALYEEMAAHAKKHAFSTDGVIGMEVEESIALGDFDEALRLAGQITPDSVYGADSELRVALVHIARMGPDKTAEVDAPRRRLLNAAVLWQSFVTTTAQVYLLAEQPRVALEHAEPAKDMLRTGSPRFTLDVAVICAIEAARRLGDDAALDGWITVALDERAVAESLLRRARRSFAGAERAQRSGDLGRALALSAASVEALDHSQWPFIETLARLRHAELLLERGTHEDRVIANAELSTVVAFWRRAGAPWYLGRLRDWAREHGLRVPPAASTEPRSTRALTRREREVAGLVTDGLTNRQIAERLVIAERTVESHVERIMDKLSRHSRAEIAAWMSAAGRR
jgi:DNA-binding CsgD family transcriptional regulator/tetratricopeptide (TPR) repeat protein